MEELQNSSRIGPVSGFRFTLHHMASSSSRTAAKHCQTNDPHPKKPKDCIPKSFNSNTHEIKLFCNKHADEKSNPDSNKCFQFIPRRVKIDKVSVYTSRAHRHMLTCTYSLSRASNTYFSALEVQK